MPTRLDRSQFVQTLQDTKVDVAKAEADENLRKIIPSKADLNKDGVIEGAAEADVLFTQIDSFGRTPQTQTSVLTGPDGRGTQSAAAIKALGTMTSNPAIVAWTEGIDTSPQVDLAQIRTPAGVTGTPAAMVGAAAMLVRERKDNYGLMQPWYNIDPNHALPANKPLRGLGKTEARPNGTWKCNLYAGNALHAAGFEPPYYSNKGKGDYPNANQFYKFSDRYAAKNGNKVHFKVIDEVKVSGVEPDQANTRLIEVLRTAKPGDLIVVKHQGTELADGGHVRVVMQNDLQEDGSGSIHSAQATYNDADIRAEQLSSFTGEESVWILRPNRPAAKPIPRS